MAWLFTSLLVISNASASITSPAKNLGFRTPTFTASESKKILEQYGYIDARHVIPDDLLRRAILYFDFNHERIPNQNVISIVDFSQHSSVARWYFIDMKTGVVTARHTSHGVGSDPTTKKYPHGTGYARKFSNVENSHESSIGFYLAAETYTGEHGVSIWLDGLSSTNSNARERVVVVHQADYVIEENKLQGRSDGCFAVAPSEHDAVIAEISGGSLLYADRSK